MSIQLPVTEPKQQAPVVCRMLRTKMAYANYGAVRAPWQSGESTTAVFWCLATMGTAGPDDKYAHPHACGESRRCFQRPVE